MPYVDLSRRFRDLTPEELESPELLASLNEHHSLRWSDGWNDLLQHPRVLLLAEAGSGKTEEMREQAKRLLADGKPAFFIALESLGHELLLSPEEKRTFAAWKVEGQATAWFFLDAADELKLTGGKLGRAFERLASAIDGYLHRAHIVISCRPSDWRPSVDMAKFKEKLPFTPAQPIELPESDEIFLAALRKREGNRETGRKKMAAEGSPRAVVLLPLSERQIAILAYSLEIGDTEEFLAEIRRRDAWTFARRPLDLIELVTSWKANRRLGTRAQQHAANVTAKLKDDPDRRDYGLLTDECARLGAERLALALTLTRTRAIRSPELALDSDRAEGVLDSAEILKDWTEEKRKTLLRRALFDPATYGRVRFHHRSVQEYLAACHLRALREKGMPAKCLRRLLFTERYGVQLVVPSMQAIAAWLALWDDDVRRELMAREPETLLAMGDPESLPIETRVQLLRRFSEIYGEGEWRGLNIPIDQVRRLADPKLAGVVRELWEAKPTSPDVKELLLEAIWQGPIEGCMDIANTVAFEVDESEYLRMRAIRALAASPKAEIMHELSRSILSEPAKWPDRVVYVAVEELFPAYLSVGELVSLLQRSCELENSGSGYLSFVREISESIEPSSSLAIELRDALADLVWRGRNEKQELYHLKGRFDSLAPALAQLCRRQLEANLAGANRDSRLIWACAVANRFGRDELGATELHKNLRGHFKNSPALREVAFWSEIKLISEAAPMANTTQRHYCAEHDSLVQRVAADDRPWLLRALRSSRHSDYRLIALHALLSLWISGGREQVELDELSAAVQYDADLTEVLRQASTPPEPDREYEERQRREHREKLVHEGHERQRLEEWLSWKKQLLADPEAAFTAEGLPTATRNLYHWLEASQGSGSRYNIWDTDALQKAFGGDIVVRAAKAFQTVWRTHPPILRSQRPQDQRNTTLGVWCEGLTGLAAEAMTPGWATRLTSDEARTAAAYATIELNEFPSWLEDLSAAHPLMVDAVIGGELDAELALEQEHSRTLQNLSHTSIRVKQLLLPRLVAALPDWPSTFKNEECSRQAAYHLARILDTLSDVIDGEKRTTVVDLCIRRFLRDPIGPLALAWIQGAFRLDIERATQALEEGLASIAAEVRSEYAIRMLGSLFGHLDMSLKLADEGRRAAALSRLVRCAYHYVRPAEDQHHEGAYSPNERDLAERARDFLLMTLVDTPGPEAHKIVLDLAADPTFGHFPDRLRLLARQRAAKDAEGAGLRPEEIGDLEKRYEIPPGDRDGLFTLMIDRLDDLAHDIAHDDLTDRRTLQTIKDECEMQRTLARRLQDAAKGAYIISREEEVADLKRTDIRLAATRSEQKAVIEVKIAERWSFSELEHALRVQLVGQYLRHKTCKAGCLLLTYSGTKRHWERPETGERLSLAEVVEYLSRSAHAIVQEMNDEVQLAVLALDLTDPPGPARR